MAKDCNCADPVGHAKAVESAVFQSVMNAMHNPEREAHWFAHADRLESKFITDHGQHYSLAALGGGGNG